MGSKAGWTVAAILITVLVVGGIVAAVTASKKKNRTYNLVYAESPL